MTTRRLTCSLALALLFATTASAQMPPSAPNFDRSAITLMIPPALLMTGLALYLVGQMLAAGRPLAEIQNAVLLMTVLFQTGYVLCMRSERRPIFREPLLSNAWLLLGVGIELGLQAIATLWSPLGNALGTAPVSAATMQFCVFAVVGTIAVTEATKQAVAVWQRRR